MRIQGELLKHGIRVSATTVATVLRRSGLGPAPRRIGPTWSEFLRAQAQSMLGAGLPAEPGGRLGDNPCERAAPAPEGEVCRVEADELSRSGADEARRPSRPFARSAAVCCRGPAFSPRLEERAPAVIAAMACARWTQGTRAPSLHRRVSGPGVKAVARSLPACGPQPRVASSRAAARIFDLDASAQQTEYSSELTAEPSFFTPHAEPPLHHAPAFAHSLVLLAHKLAHGDRKACKSAHSKRSRKPSHAVGEASKACSAPFIHAKRRGTVRNRSR